jgi:hypothetical protein
MQATSDEALMGRIAAGDKLAMHLLFARQNQSIPPSLCADLPFPGMAEKTLGIARNSLPCIAIRRNIQPRRTVQVR